MRRLFISVNPIFRVIFEEPLSKEINKRLPDYEWEILYYCSKKKQWVDEKDSPKIILMRDHIERLSEKLLPITENDYLVRHYNEFKLGYKFSFIKKGATEHKNNVWLTVFKEICEGVDESAIIKKIIDKLWPEEDEWRVKDEFMTRIFSGERPSQIFDANSSVLKGYDFSAFKDKYEPFENKSYTEIKNEKGVKEAEELYVIMRDALMSIK